MFLVRLFLVLTRKDDAINHKNGTVVLRKGGIQCEEHTDAVGTEYGGEFIVLLYSGYRLN